ncbi:MAG: hypothetical protein JKY18_06230 [Flavobacteriales bacterium]|nr:hypothetical protein [Flavobacteriales bacterium]PCH88244.1 MAG: hypothetical protein COB88_04235 [Flavobacteriales bacterium]
MEKIIKAPAIVLLILILLPWSIVQLISDEFPTVQAVFGALGCITLWGWIAILAESLKSRLPGNVEISDTLFLINIVVLILSFGGIHILLEPGQTVHVTGLYVLPIVYVFYAIFQVYAHIAKLLTSAEEMKEVKFSHRIGEMFLFYFFIIGIFWLQPRIRKVLDRPIPEDKAGKEYST